MTYFIYRIALSFFTIWEKMFMKVYLKICELKGMKLGKDVRVFERVYFGSEPFLIEIGDKTQIAGGTRFVNHGGTTMTLRRLPGFEESEDKMQPGFEAENDLIFLLIPKVNESVRIGPDNINCPLSPGVTSAINLFSSSKTTFISE